jgi:DNA-binding CsgD family transcriptional regulator
MTNKEIALHVGISLSTVYGAVRIVERKTGSKILELLTLAK